MTDQGKLSNINGLAVLAQSLNEGIPQVGTTTFRPPYTPVTLGALAGEARDDIFQSAAAARSGVAYRSAGAYMGSRAGLWRRPYCYPAVGESQ